MVLVSVLVGTGPVVWGVPLRTPDLRHAWEMQVQACWLALRRAVVWSLALRRTPPGVFHSLCTPLVRSGKRSNDLSLAPLLENASPRDAVPFSCECSGTLLPAVAFLEGAPTIYTLLLVGASLLLALLLPNASVPPARLLMGTYVPCVPLCANVASLVPLCIALGHPSASRATARGRSCTVSAAVLHP